MESSIWNVPRSVRSIINATLSTFCQYAARPCSTRSVVGCFVVVLRTVCAFAISRLLFGWAYFIHLALGVHGQRSFRTNRTCVERYACNVFSVTARVHLDSSLGFFKEPWGCLIRLHAFSPPCTSSESVANMFTPCAWWWWSATAAPGLSICMLILLSTVMGCLEKPPRLQSGISEHV